MSGNAKRERLLEAMRARNAAEDNLGEVLSECWPVESAIRWVRGRYEHAGMVTNVGNRGVKVRNILTDKEYWITAYDILSVDEQLRERLFA